MSRMPTQGAQRKSAGGRKYLSEPRKCHSGLTSGDLLREPEPPRVNFADAVTGSVEGYPCAGKDRLAVIKCKVETD